MTRRKTISFSLATVALTLLLIHSPGLIELRAAAPLQITLELRSKSMNDRPEETWTTTATIGGHEWQMECGAAINGTTILYSDSTNVFKTFCFDPEESSPELAGASGSLARRPGQQNSVLIVPGPHPMGGTGENIVWLALLSAKYLKAPGALVPLVRGEVRHSIESFGVEAQTEFFDTDPFLPKRVAFLSKEANLARAAESYFVFRSSTKPFHLKSNLKDGTLQARYEVLETTNVFAATLPLAFRYAEYYALTSSLRVSYELNGRIVAVSEVETVPPILQEGVAHNIRDTRFRHKTRVFDSLRYTHARSVLPATNDPAMLEMVEAAAQRRPLAR